MAVSILEYYYRLDHFGVHREICYEIHITYMLNVII